MSSLQRSLAEITNQLATMRARANAPEADLLRTVPKISEWCAAQHLDHLARVSSSILRRLANPDPIPPSRGATLLGRLVLGLGWIPRGRGKTPERLEGVCVSTEKLLASFDEMDALMNSIDATVLANSPIVAHPKFGGLTPSQALRFVSIHNAHHLKIMDDLARS